MRAQTDTRMRVGGYDNYNGEPKREIFVEISDKKRVEISFRCNLLGIIAHSSLPRATSENFYAIETVDTQRLTRHFIGVTRAPSGLPIERVHRGEN